VRGAEARVLGRVNSSGAASDLLNSGMPLTAHLSLSLSLTHTHTHIQSHTHTHSLCSMPPDLFQHPAAAKFIRDLAAVMQQESRSGPGKKVALYLGGQALASGERGSEGGGGAEKMSRAPFL
jgi:hypothetical protein